MENLTFEEVKAYLDKQGHEIDINNPTHIEILKWFLNREERKEQVIEAVRNHYDLCDFDRWQHIQRIIFGDDEKVLSFKTAMKISEALWEENIEVLELKTFRDKE